MILEKVLDLGSVSQNQPENGLQELNKMMQKRHFVITERSKSEDPRFALIMISTTLHGTSGKAGFCGSISQLGNRKNKTALFHSGLVHSPQDNTCCHEVLPWPQLSCGSFPLIIKLLAQSLECYHECAQQTKNK